MRQMIGALFIGAFAACSLPSLTHAAHGPQASPPPSPPSQSDVDFDGIPDADDQDPLVARYPIQWEISAVRLCWEWDVLEGESESKTTEGSKSKRTATSEEWSYGVDGKIEVKAEAHLAVSMNPLTTLGSGASASISSSGSTSADWRTAGKDSTAAETRVADAISRMKSTKYTKPHLIFEVNFRTYDRQAFELRSATVPVFVKGRHLLNARPVEDGSVFSLPGGRPTGVSMQFRADLTNTDASAVIQALESGTSPIIDLTRGRLEIRKVGTESVDYVVAVREMEASTVPVSLSIGGDVVTFRVARHAPDGHPVTLGESLAAIRQLAVRGKRQDAARSMPSSADGTPTTSPTGEDGLPVEKWLVRTGDSYVAADAAAYGRILTKDGCTLELVRRAEVVKCLDEHFRQLMNVDGGAHPSHAGSTRQAAPVWRLTSQAPHGWPEARVLWADAVARGLDGEPNISEGVRILREAAESGNACAMYALGECCCFGRSLDKDFAKAVDWYSRAADKGSAGAMTSLGACYAEGEGVEQSWTKAVEWFRLAADKGDARAMGWIGVCYTNGKGVEQSWTKAVEWYRRAADKGDASAMCSLGVCHMDGTGVEFSRVKAVEWFRLAADRGDTTAMFYLGRYADPDDGERGLTTQFEWYKRAADGGDIDAMSVVARYYEMGWGVEADGDAAARWRQRAKAAKR